ncbi:hypothetical protein CB0940_05489 [Cercospora beticola]|uniref:Vacuolar ATPase assembly protein VMA22 n=1 Tax=Cercospora beticola TaxID=122368 RepID=A0A2G5I0X9_CERBT|nr:hypothetical protein CB0940_05489 [Cercospora beticola]PIA98162.1 hypothetical protein CB0940_05489 [Cercospora beticola]WPA98040.1 hypothetical protein RHO25_002651 [Cercospora beticola]CAK1359251.1 unnamed protein product [Cercospora beticola]
MANEQAEEKGTGSQLESLSSLYSQLDTLWAQYLDLVDDYITAQAAIKEHMSSGFFSLAQANFKSSRGRYGQDYYDERAVATTRTIVEAQDQGISMRVVKNAVAVEASSTSKATSDGSEEQGLPDKQSEESTEKSHPADYPTPAATPEPEGKQEPLNVRNATLQETRKPGVKMNSSENVSEIQTAKPKIDPRDPIRWFGILVPPTLRQAQASFNSALLDSQSLSKALNGSRRMREVEAEIRKLRKIIKKAEKTIESSAQLPVQDEVQASS